jgi:hypothetical protein
MQSTSFQRRITLLSVACLAVANFSTLPRKCHDFREKKVKYRMCFYPVYNFCVYTSHFKARHYHKYKKPSCKVPFILPDFNETQIFLKDFREILKCQIS